jgi:soluble cytochrome b562
MDNELLKLRQQSYDAASAYHAAVSDRLRVRPNSTAAHSLSVKERFNDTALKYGEALEMLVTYLDSRTTDENSGELERARAAHQVLQREIKLMG